MKAHINSTKTYLSWTVVLFLCGWAVCCSAQTPSAGGKAILLEYINASASFQVPEGKTWYIQNVFSDYLVDGVINPGAQTAKPVFEKERAVHIFLKEMNGVEKTNHLKNIYGPHLFASTDASSAIPYPLIFPEKTSFSLVLLKGEPGFFDYHIGSGYISLLEVENK